MIQNILNTKVQQFLIKTAYMLLYPNWQRKTAQTRYSFGSNPKGSTIWGRSSIGRAPALQAGGSGIVTHRFHHQMIIRSIVFRARGNGLEILPAKNTIVLGRACNAVQYEGRANYIGWQSVIGTAPDCKSGSNDIVGSSPTQPTKCLDSSMVEQQTHILYCIGSSPFRGTNIRQQHNGECTRPRTLDCGGSNPLWRTKDGYSKIKWLKFCS